MAKISSCFYSSLFRLFHSVSVFSVRFLRGKVEGGAPPRACNPPAYITEQRRLVLHKILPVSTSLLPSKAYVCFRGNSWVFPP